jgi:hypothetical protein
MIGVAAAVAVGVTVVAVATLRAQESWTPPTSDMPEMPQSSSLAGQWRGALASWFRGAGPLDGVRAVGDGVSSALPGGVRARLVRFVGGARPVATWTDRNGDGRADMIEVFRDGAVAYQLIDADYDGGANVLRVYDASGGLAREQRY